MRRTGHKENANRLKPGIAAAWMGRNLFSSPFNVLLTLSSLYLLYISVPPVIRWAFLDADWTGTGRQACGGEGACWVFISNRINQFIYGFYPAGEQWRVNLVLVLLAAGLIPFLFKRYLVGWLYALGMISVLVSTSAVLLAGGYFGLRPVETAKWGGLMLTLTISTVGISASLPIGIMLALGRRSDMPAVRFLSTAFIEFWRGVPLITVLFMASVMLPLFLPEGVTFDKLLRALIGMVLFQSAYMAEVVRGGLQAVPRGQLEAAEALGLGYWRRMGLIVLPQALKHVIPGIVNTFIALFKDSALVLIIGIFDLLGMVQAAFADPEWLGFALEGYVFAGLVFWTFCFGMSRFSQTLEKRLAAGRPSHG